MTDVHILAIDLAKRSFQLCATAPGGAVLFNRVVPRAKLEAALREQAPCIVAIAEPALRPNLPYYVAVKSAEHQARAVAFRTHQSFVGQRTQLINALHGHLAEFGLVTRQRSTGGNTRLGAVSKMKRRRTPSVPAAPQHRLICPTSIPTSRRFIDARSSDWRKHYRSRRSVRTPPMRCGC